jgi:hypothetical protein
VGELAWRQGRLAEVEAACTESLALMRSAGDTLGAAWSLGGLQALADARGDDALARQLAEECLALFRAANSPYGLAWGLTSFAEIALKQGDGGRAARLLAESLPLAYAVDDMSNVMQILGQFSVLASRNGRHPRAARVGGAADKLWTSLGMPATEGYQDWIESLTHAARGDGVTGEAWDAVWAEGRAMTVEQAMAYALSDEI